MTSDFDGLALLAWAQLWQVTLVALGIGTMVKLGCRNRPRLAYALWMLVVVKAIVPPLWSSPTGVFSWALASRATAQPAFTQEQAAIAFQAMPPFGKGPAVAHGGFIDLVRDFFRQWDRSYLLIFAIWAAGFALCAAFVIAKQIICAVVIRRSSLAVDQRYGLAPADLSRSLGVKRHVRLIVTSRPIGPAVFGLIRPSILMPAALLSGNPPEQIELLMAHELIHVRRGDIVAGKLQLFAQLVWWFHPLVWWVNRVACHDRERCCDLEVVSGVGCKPACYARALLNVVEQKSQLRSLVAIPGVRALEVTTVRLESIMRFKKTDHRRASLSSRIVFLIGAVALVPGTGLTLRAHASLDDKADGTAVAAPANSIVVTVTVTQNVAQSGGKTSAKQGANGRWRAQQIVARKAEANYRNATLTREVAEIAVLEYEEGVFQQDLATVKAEIKLAESDLERVKDRLDWARRMFKKGYVSKAKVVSEELALKKGRFSLEQAQSKKKVLVDYTRGKTLKELRSEVEKARSDELTKKATWEREKAKESAIEREANHWRVGEFSSQE